MKGNKGLILFLFIFGIIFLIAGLENFYVNYHLISKGIETEGTVVKMVHRYSRRGGPTYVPVISYRSEDGKEHTFRSNIFYRDSLEYAAGDKINICYNPQDHDHATLADEDEYLLPLIMGGGMGLLMCVGGVYVYRRDKRKNLPSAN